MEGEAPEHLKLLRGGVFEKGDRVLVGEAKSPGTVVYARFSSFVFRGEISVELDEGGFAMVAPAALEHRDHQEKDPEESKPTEKGGAR